MTPRLLPVLSLAVLAPLAAQRVELPVHDLIQSAHLRKPGFEEEEAPPSETWVYRTLEPGWEQMMGQGEYALFHDQEARPWFVPSGLESVLRALSGLESAPMNVEDGMLVVERPDAEAVRGALAELRNQLPPRVALDLALVRKSKADARTLLHVRESVPAGRTVTFGDVVGHSEVRDFEVEIAQAASVADPVIVRTANGSCMAARIRIVPGRGEMLIEVFARVAEAADAPKIETGNDGIKGIERGARRISASGFAMRVPRGAKRVVGWTAANGDRLELTCSGNWVDPKGGPAKGALVRCRGLFHKPVLGFRTDVPEPDEVGEKFAAEAAFERAGAERAELVGDEETATAAIVVTGAKAEQIDADVVARLARSLAGVELGVVLLDVPAEVPDAAALEKGTALARVDSPVLAGRSVAFSGRTEMFYLRDWDVEVAQSSRICDPKVDLFRHGYNVDAEVLTGAEGRIDRVAIQARVARLARIDRRPLSISRESRAGGFPTKEGTITPAIVLPADNVAVESPVLQQHEVHTVVHLDQDGRAILRRAAPRLLGDGRELVVVVTVRR